MKLKKQLTQMVKTDYKPLQTTAEGKLTGGFGNLLSTPSPAGHVFNFICSGRNDGCTLNQCPPPSPSTSTSASPTSDGTPPTHPANAQPTQMANVAMFGF